MLCLAGVHMLWRVPKIVAMDANKLKGILEITVLRVVSLVYGNTLHLNQPFRATNRC